MELEIRRAPENSQPDRIYIAAAILRKFHGKENVEVQLFRVGATDQEMADLKRHPGLVGPAAADIPADILAGATEGAALACLLEAFTKAEAEALAEYLGERYADQIVKLTICPMELPVPLGIGPLAKIPESESSGFINFDQAPNYPLGFNFKGLYMMPE